MVRFPAPAQFTTPTNVERGGGLDRVAERPLALRYDCPELAPIGAGTNRPALVPLGHSRSVDPARPPPAAGWLAVWGEWQ
jgi:hypothetical protein